MRRDSTDFFEELLRRHCRNYGSAAMEFPARYRNSESTLKRKCAGGRAVSPEDIFFLEGRFGDFTFTEERVADVLRMARRIGIDCGDVGRDFRAICAEIPAAMAKQKGARR